MSTLPIPLHEIPTATLDQNGTAAQSTFRNSLSTHTHSSEHAPEKVNTPRRPAGRRKITAVGTTTPDATHNKEELNSMGRMYQKLGDYSFATRYALYIVPVALLLAIPIIVGATAASSAKIGGVRVVWFFTWIEAVWLVLWGMKFFAKTIPIIFSFFAGVVNLGTKKYARVLRNLETTIMILGWVVISFVLFEVLFETAAAGNTPLPWTTVMRQILASILIATIIFSVEKIFMQVLSVSYHARSFNRKIKQTRQYVSLLAILLDASKELFPLYSDDFLEEDVIIHSNIEAFFRKEANAQKSHGTTVRKDRLINGLGRMGRYANRIGGTVQTAFGNVAQELTGKTILDRNSAESIVIESLERTRSAKALARRLWFSFVVEGRNELLLDDLVEILGADSYDTAKECFDMLDPDINAGVSLDEMVLRVTEICVSRKAIAKSMHDVSQAIKALDKVLVAVVLLVSVFVLVSFLDTGFSTILSTTSTALLSLSFVFSPTAQEFLGSCIFLFAKHPYDISDRVDIQGPDGKNRLIVDQISLLYTAFKRIDDMELIQVPNIVLNSLWINNITRSATLKERIEIAISFDTTIEDIERLRREIETFVQSKENRREYQADINIRVMSVNSMDKLQLTLEFKHKSNWSVENIRAARHSKFMCALVLALRKVGINAPGGGKPALGEPLNPTYSVNISDDTAQTFKKKAAEDIAPATSFSNDEVIVDEPKDEQRLPKTSTKHIAALASIAETEASDSMNAINYLDEIRLPDHDEVNIDGSKDAGTGIRRTTSTSVEAQENGSLLRQRSNSSAAGRRQAGLQATSVLSNTASHPYSNQQRQPAIVSRARSRLDDPEAQNGRHGTW